MGEAKRRRKIEPHFGKKPKHGRGLLLSVPMMFDGNRFIAEQTTIASEELRRSVLFFDRLVWPDSRIISFDSGPDEALLQQEGILRRPTATVASLGNSAGLARFSNSFNMTVSGEAAQQFIAEHTAAYRALDANEPGNWVMSQGQGSLFFQNENYVPGRGQIVNLQRAIPLPSPDFPLPELLEFKLRRADEINDLLYEIDKFYSQVMSSKDEAFELGRLVAVIDRKCANLIEVSKESKWKFGLGDFSYSFSVDNVDAAFNRAVTWELAGQSVGLPIVGGVLGGGISLVSFGRGFGIKERKDHTSPFNVVSKIHHELG